MNKIIEQHNWRDLGVQKMKGLLSFSKEHFRINFFTTTGTIVIQDTRKKYDKGQSWKNVTEDDLISILENYDGL